MDYFDIYGLRLNRYGLNRQERVQTQREKEFDSFLSKSPSQVSFFQYEHLHYAVLTRDKQNPSQTTHFLLTKRDFKVPSGTVLQLRRLGGSYSHWMVYFLEDIAASGYNKYTLLKMTHFLKWRAQNGSFQVSWAYMHGKETAAIKNQIMSNSTSTVYGENQNLSTFIMPRTPFLKIDDYFEVGHAPYIESYRVTGFDIQSTKGVQYVSVDPIHKFDLTPAPKPTLEDNPSDFYWLGGISND